jgi:hypothetical protein
VIAGVFDNFGASLGMVMGELAQGNWGKRSMPTLRLRGQIDETNPIWGGWARQINEMKSTKRSQFPGAGLTGAV